MHRTFLAPNGSKAPVEPQRMMLGPCRGGAIRLGDADGSSLMLAEGIETALSVMQARGKGAWAALSASGLRSIELPTEIEQVIIFADGDDAGETAAQFAARRFRHEGRRVRIARPPRGTDFNDLLMSARAGTVADEDRRGDQRGAANRGYRRGGRVTARNHGVQKMRRLRVDLANPDRGVAELRDILRDAGEFYDRGLPVWISVDQIQGGAVIHPVTPELLMLRAHAHCRPYRLKANGKELMEEDTALPARFALMYLHWRGKSGLPVLNGISSAPILHDDGAVRCSDGYDLATGMWCENVPDLQGLVPDQPTKANAAAALQVLRQMFDTFCFADAEMVLDESTGMMVVNTSCSPGRDESAFLVALLTAVCRPSLWFAPGVLVRAPSISGAGAGKGLLARCICTIAFGREPHAVTSGETKEEFEKRLTAELIGGAPALFLDNFNNRAVKSDQLASAITERPSRVRVLGRSHTLPLNATAFVVITGNGLSVSEDLARRFIAVELDPHMEDPESRRFTTDILGEVKARRLELLAAALTIWRWGRRTADLAPGKPLGNFEQWGMWVRDPLLALGCKDPVERVAEAKEQDSRRVEIADLFNIWWKRHQDRPVRIAELHDDVRHAIDPQKRGRQFVAAKLQRLVDTRLGGFVLTRQAPAGDWGAATYSLRCADNGGAHRDHRGDEGPPTPNSPMPPMPLATEVPAEQPARRWKLSI